ncbi:MAG: QueT transporter family protein [bacterium]|nr:QueT transporter family protein [bacterium]
MNPRPISQITFAGVVAALYAVLTLALAPISFGVYQLRVAEALTVLPFLNRGAIAGLYVGCLVANYFGGQGILDIIIGPILTAGAATITYWLRRWEFGSLRLRTWLAPMPAVLFNAFGVAAYLAPIIQVDYWFAVQMIGLGELAACYLLGLPFLWILEKRIGWIFRGEQPSGQART